MISTLIVYLRSMSSWLTGETFETIPPDDQLHMMDSLMPVYALVPCLILGVFIGVVISFVHQVDRPCLEPRGHFDCKTTEAQVRKWKNKPICEQRGQHGIGSACGDVGTHEDSAERAKGRRHRASGNQEDEDAGDRDIAQMTKWRRTTAVDDNRVGIARCHTCHCGHTRKKSGRLSKVSFKNGRLCRNVADLRVHRNQGLNVF